MNSFINRAIYFTLVFICISVPLPYRFSNLGIVALVIFWVLKKVLFKEKISALKSNNNWNWGVMSFLMLFAWQAISLMYNTDLEMGLKNLESKLSLLILPIILVDLNIAKYDILNFFKYYVYSIIACNLFLFFVSYINYYESGTFLTYHDFTEVLGFHAVFYSYCLFLSILLSYFLLSKYYLNNKERGVHLASIFMAFIALVVSASKNVLVVTCLSILTLLVSKILKGKIKWSYILLILGIGAISILTAYQSASIKNRISELTQLNGIENLDKIKNGEVLEHEDRVKFNGTSLRIVFWYLGLKKLDEDNRKIIGLSPGDRRAVMNNEFKKVGLYPAYKNYNIHNQFIQTLIELGIIGLILYLAIHLIYIRKAIHTKNYILLAFILALIVFQITESVIERNKGIVFYVFFLLLIEQLSLNKNENRNIRN